MLDSTFRDLVAEDVKGRASAAQQQFLVRNPERWLAALADLQVDLDGQAERNAARLAQMRAGRHETDPLDEATIAAEFELERREAKRAQFAHHLARRIADVRALVSPTDQLTAAEREVQLLRWAIDEHRRQVTGSGDPVRPVDRVLYAVLAGEWLFDDGPIEGPEA